MDLRKAFDTVSHEILLKKLYHYGIRGPAHELIESYLSSRNQFVSINNSKSSVNSINIGVPQGSILGPLLFLIYINDLQNAIFNPRLFADDTCLIISDPSLENLEFQCNSELRKLHNWCNCNKLQINPQKSAVILIPPKVNDNNCDFKLLYNDCFITSTESYKYLGVTLDKKLDFKVHISNIVTKTSRSIGILSKLRHVFPSSTLLLLYYALVQPHLLYGITLWGSTFPSYLTKLQKLQNKAIRIITKTNIRSSVTPQFRKLGILKISELYTFETAKLMHQHSTNMLPQNLSTYFKELTSIHHRHTRSKTKKKLYLPKFSTNRCQKSFRYQGVKVWNLLSTELRTQSFRQFKKELKKLLLENYR